MDIQYTRLAPGYYKVEDMQAVRHLAYIYQKHRNSVANFNWIAEGAGGTIISGADTLKALKRNLEEILPTLPNPWA